MNFYEQRVLPHLVNWSMRQPTFTEYRSRVLRNAEGCVLEIDLRAQRLDHVRESLARESREVADGQKETRATARTREQPGSPRLGGS